MPEKVGAVYEASRQAGKRLVEEGRIPPELEAEVAKELLPRDAFVKAMNDFFRKAWDSALEKESKREARFAVLSSRPDPPSKA